MIYFIQAKGSNRIKIGFTSKPTIKQRLRNLQTDNSTRLVVLFFQDGCERLEHSRHDRFGYARAHGEWFRPVPELLDHIDRMRGTKYPRKGSLLGKFIRKYNLEAEWDGGTLPTLRRWASHMGVLIG